MGCAAKRAAAAGTGGSESGGVVGLLFICLEKLSKEQIFSEAPGDSPGEKQGETKPRTFGDRADAVRVNCGWIALWKLGKLISNPT